MKDKIVLITGSTDGIGKQTAIDLARKNARVIVHGRNLQKAELAMQEVISVSGNRNVYCVAADLSSLKQITAMADELQHRFDRLNVLINNAGVFMNSRLLSDDGFETTFAVNHLSYFLLTGLLLPLLKKPAEARIVNVASMAHATHLDFENLQAEKHFSGYDAYARSKLCNILFTYHLARVLRPQHITVNALHPGVIGTKLLRRGFNVGGAGLAQGSHTSVFLASSAEVAGVSGKYFSNSREVSSAAVSYDTEVQNKLWQVSEQITGFKYTFG